jgi:hypothetical protein
MEGFTMKRITAYKLNKAQEILDTYNKENSNFSFSIPSLMQYCIENEVRSMMKEKKLDTVQVDQIFKTLNFNVKISLASKHQVKVKLVYDKT